jgi:hypothetical protein
LTDITSMYVLFTSGIFCHHLLGHSGLRKLDLYSWRMMN